jgi:starch synthase
LTTVSPTYATEIQSEQHGMGLHGLLALRRNVLTGILNGIDTAAWDPKLDPYIARHYDTATLADKMHNKRALQARAGLPHADVPLLAMVSRLTEQKGIDWIVEIGAALAELPAQLVVLGQGEPRYERAIRALAESYPRHVSATLAFDEPLAHLIEAGADVFLMPSRFEPCGMNQMYSQRYGTVPIVRATGGLVDSVEDYSTGTGSGFVFQEASAGALLATIRQALEIYRDRTAWRLLQLNGMKRDFGWEASARRYLEIYQRVAAVPGR